MQAELVRRHPGSTEVTAVAPWPEPGIGSVIFTEIEKWAPGDRALTAEEWAEQRARQVELVMWHLTIRAKFGRLWQQGLDDTVQVAVNMLRADPYSLPLQQLQGRYV